MDRVDYNFRIRLYCTIVFLVLFSGCTNSRFPAEAVRSDAIYTKGGEVKVTEESLKKKFAGKYNVRPGSGIDSDYENPKVIEWTKPKEVPFLWEDNKVIVEAVIGSDGTVIEAVVTESTDSSLNEIALDALKSFRFEPMKYKGVPVQFNGRFPFEFPGQAFTLESRILPVVPQP
ncbi:MAG: energy transducer TonB [Puniceicoccaceae bacterium]